MREARQWQPRDSRAPFRKRHAFWWNSSKTVFQQLLCRYSSRRLMKHVLLCVLLACSLHAAAVDVQISDVGLNRYIGTNTVTPLTLRLVNPDVSQAPITLRIEISEPRFVI